VTHNAWHGDIVTLRDVEPGDWEAFYSFDQDTEAARAGYQIHFPRSREGGRLWAEEKARTKPADDNHFFAITDSEGTIVGGISTHRCEPKHGTFKYGVSLGRSAWGKGYAADAMRVLFRYYFDELGYHVAWSEVYAFNERSIALHEKFGMVLEGRLREAHYTAGKRHDVLVYSLTAPEFRLRLGVSANAGGQRR
jgi:RimJ/RimL family protein N-acetyltransferase